MQMAKMSMNDEEFKQHQKMKRLEAEAQEEVMRLRTMRAEMRCCCVLGQADSGQTEGGQDEGNESR